MEERELTFFTSSNFPPGGYAVPDEHKNGAYFVQGRSQFFFFFCEESRNIKACKIPGDVVQRKFQPGPLLFRGARLMSSRRHGGTLGYAIELPVTARSYGKTN